MMGKDEAAPQLMTVRQLAQQGDVTVHVVRNYLRRGLLQAARFGWSLGGETVSVPMLVSAGIIIFSVVLITRSHPDGQ